MDFAITWIDSLFSVFIMCIVVRVLMSWITIAPMRSWSRAIVEFFHDTTGWYLGFFRRIIPPAGPLDLSPMVAIIVAIIVQQFVVRIIESVG